MGILIPERCFVLTELSPSSLSADFSRLGSFPDSADSFVLDCHIHLVQAQPCSGAPGTLRAGVSDSFAKDLWSVVILFGGDGGIYLEF